SASLKSDSFHPFKIFTGLPRNPGGTVQFVRHNHHPSTLHGLQHRKRIVSNIIHDSAPLRFWGELPLKPNRVISSDPENSRQSPVRGYRGPWQAFNALGYILGVNLVNGQGRFGATNVARARWSAVRVLETQIRFWSGLDILLSSAPGQASRTESEGT
ncbi:hypothetical protein FRC03_007774, partial [Tulasnella sp. 419]